MTRRAITRAQKRQLLTKLLTLWYERPDERLGQFIVSARMGRETRHPDRDGGGVMESAKPETLEACHELITMMDREVAGAMDDRAKARAIIANVRALLTTVDAPDTVGSVDWKNNGAHAMWRAAIKQALGE